MSYATILQMISIAPSSYRRWKSRMRKGDSPISKPGPKPLAPLNLRKLLRELDQLDHKRKKSLGTGRLHTKMSAEISRRELQNRVVAARKNHFHKQKALQYRLCWHIPGSIWSMDIFEFHQPAILGKCTVLTVQDLASAYKFPPLSFKGTLHGNAVAFHLGRLFKSFGIPLFLKRDNGGNLNQSSVTDLLSENFIIPMNSPGYYAPYNGAIEHAQGEFKSQLRRNCDNSLSFKEFSLSVQLAAHQLNHIKRRQFQENTSCKLFFKEPLASFPKRKREEVLLWIKTRTTDIVEKAKPGLSMAAAWRIACKTWLVKNKLLSISQPGDVLPSFSEVFAHY